MSGKYVIYIVAMVLALTGCAPGPGKPLRICPGAGSTDEAISSLKKYAAKAVAFKATGRCCLKYYADEKEHKENFPVKIWLNPPAEFYLQADAAFDPKAITAGSNDKEFWLAIRPKQISSYWWGNWSDAASESLMISPAIILEALGSCDTAAGKNWLLSKQKGFDILIKQDEQQKTIKKIHIYNCDGLVRKIEYLADNKENSIILKTEDYKEILEGFYVPSVINICKFEAGRSKEKLQISLRSVKHTKLSEIQRSRMFARPKQHRFQHIYKIVGDRWIEQAATQ